MSEGSSNLDAALGYIARGWPVLPLAWPLATGESARCSCDESTCKRIGKHPHGRLVRHGLREATRDPGKARQWWGVAPLANVGIVLGQAAGMFAIDIDPKAGGDATIVDLILEHGPLVEQLDGAARVTLAAVTGSGGAHYFYRWPGQRVSGVAGTLTQAAKGGFGPGVDVRGDDGYVVAAPSLHASGARYRWSEGTEPLDAPRWILDRVLPRPLVATRPTSTTSTTTREGADVITRASAYLARMDAAVSGSGGHQATLRAALAMVRGFGLDGPTALWLLGSEYNPRCAPRWSLRELKHKIDSAAASSRLPLGYLLEEQRA